MTTMEDDEAAADAARRANCPISLGKKSYPQTPPSSFHSGPSPPNSTPNPNPSAGAEEEDGDTVMLGPPPPASSGHVDEEEVDDVEMIGPSKPHTPARREDSDEDGSDDEFDNEPKDNNGIPSSYQIIIKGHTELVSALAVDHLGSRVLTGSYDSTVRMYDFQMTTSKLLSRMQLESLEDTVRSLSWSPTSDKFLCVQSTARAMIHDCDGRMLVKFMEGDINSRHLKKTKGHTNELTDGEWNPESEETILTSSYDGTLRIWDVNDNSSQKQVIMPKLDRPGGTVHVISCAWDHEGTGIVGGIADGSIQVWNIKSGKGSQPDVHIKSGHPGYITGLKFSADGMTLLSRSRDCTLKIWDMRNTESPLKTFENLPNQYEGTNVAFSPDEQLIFTGTSARHGKGGHICFFHLKKLELVSMLDFPQLSVIRCAWHPKINQVLATVENTTRILYDPSSQGGALVYVDRELQKSSVDDFEVKPVIHNTRALPLFRDQPSRKRQREKAAKDTLKSHKTEVPITGPWFGGRQGEMIKETWMAEDPREAILEYADVASKTPKFISPEYAATQPEPGFGKSDSEEEKCPN